MKNSFNLMIVGFVGLAIVMGCSSASKNTTTTNPATSNAAANGAATGTAKTSAPAPEAAMGGVTMANFSKIKNGMKYADVVKILGKEGEVLSESEVSGYKTVMYKWDGDEGGFGANMNAMFQNGKMMSKSQFGLK